MSNRPPSDFVFGFYHINKNGFRPPEPKVQAITPQTLTNYYHRCVPHEAEIQVLLTTQGLYEQEIQNQLDSRG